MKNLEFYDLLVIFKKYKDKLGDLNLEDILNFSDLAISRLKTVDFDKLNSISIPLVINRYVLESDYFDEYVKILSSVSNPDTAEYLLKLVTDTNSLQSEYHLADMETISETEDKYIAFYLYKLAINVNSLQSEHHLADMETISKAEDKYIAFYLYKSAINVNSLQSEHHLEDMKKCIMSYYEEEKEYTLLDIIDYVSDFETLLDDGDGEITLDNVSKIMCKARINKMINRK